MWRLDFLGLAAAAAVAGGTVYGALNPERRLAAATWVVCILIALGGLWADRWRRRAFNPQTPEEIAKAPDRQALAAKLAVGWFVGLGGLLLVMAAADRLGGG